MLRGTSTAVSAVRIGKARRLCRPRRQRACRPARHRSAGTSLSAHRCTIPLRPGAVRAHTHRRHTRALANTGTAFRRRPVAGTRLQSTRCSPGSERCRRTFLQHRRFEGRCRPKRRCTSALASSGSGRRSANQTRGQTNIGGQSPSHPHSGRRQGIRRRTDRESGLQVEPRRSDWQHTAVQSCTREAGVAGMARQRPSARTPCQPNSSARRFRDHTRRNT